MPAAPSESCASGVDCGMQSNNSHCSALKVAVPGLRSAAANSGSFGPKMSVPQVSACATDGSRSVTNTAAASTRALMGGTVLTRRCVVSPHRRGGSLLAMARKQTVMAAPPEVVWDVLSDPELYSHWVVGSSEISSWDPDWPAPHT